MPSFIKVYQKIVSRFMKNLEFFILQELFLEILGSSLQKKLQKFIISKG